MARTPVVNRRMNRTIITCLTFNRETAETETKVYDIKKTTSTNYAVVKKLEKEHGVKVLMVAERKDVKRLYQMSEDEFIAGSKMVEEIEIDDGDDDDENEEQE